MKKIFFVLGILALAVAGFAMFKVLTYIDYGKEDSKNDSSQVGSSAEKTSHEAGEETREGINP